MKLIWLLFILIFVSCRPIRHVTLVENISSCYPYFLYNNVINEIVILKEGTICNKESNWKVKNGVVKYLGNCQYQIIPNLIDIDHEDFILFDGLDSIEFFVNPPIINFCLTNFTCTPRGRDVPLSIQLLSEYKDLSIKSISYNYEVYRDGLKLFEGFGDRTELPNEIQKIKNEFHKNDTILLLNVQAKMSTNFIVSKDTIKNPYLMHIMH